MIFNHNLAAIIQKERMPQKMVMHDFFLAELCLAAGGKVFYDPNVTMQYRQHGNNTIGVSYGILRTIKDRLKDINTPMEPGISEQSKEILDIYFNRMEPETRQWLEKIAAYKSNVWNRAGLAISKKTRYANFNLGLKNRLAILLGNR